MLFLLKAHVVWLNLSIFSWFVTPGEGTWDVRRRHQGRALPSSLSPSSEGKVPEVKTKQLNYLETTDDHKSGRQEIETSGLQEVNWDQVETGLREDLQLNPISSLQAPGWSHCLTKVGRYLPCPYKDEPKGKKQADIKGRRLSASHLCKGTATVFHHQYPPLPSVPQSGCSQACGTHQGPARLPVWGSCWPGCINTPVFETGRVWGVTSQGFGPRKRSKL